MEKIIVHKPQSLANARTCKHNFQKGPKIDGRKYPTRRPPFRVAKVQAQLKLLNEARRPETTTIYTAAGGKISKETLEAWVSEHIDREALGSIIDVYIQQLCFSINQRGQLIAPNRVMFMLPHAFYNTILPPGGEVAGSAMLRAAGITTAEFRQLQYFFVPIEFNRHSNLLVLSPRNHTIEICDAIDRSETTLCRIFHVAIRFLIHELGKLEGPGSWSFLHSQCPQQLNAQDCGNFTCFFAKALALGWPLNPDTDFGQGSTRLEAQLLKLRVVDDLLLDRWDEFTMPFGKEDHRLRHAPGGAAEPQHRLFWRARKDCPADIKVLRSRTGKFDRIANKEDLVKFCLGQPQLEIPKGKPLFRPDGTPINGMAGFMRWAGMPWRAFVTRIEMRVMDILNGEFP